MGWRIRLARQKRVPLGKEGPLLAQVPSRRRKGNDILPLRRRKRPTIIFVKLRLQLFKKGSVLLKEEKGDHGLSPG